jgi:hypothetical protein
MQRSIDLGPLDVVRIRGALEAVARRYAERYPGKFAFRWESPEKGSIRVKLDAFDLAGTIEVRPGGVTVSVPTESTVVEIEREFREAVS